MAMQYNRIFNFSAGPSMLPVPVLERCRDEMLNYRGSKFPAGLSFSSSRKPLLIPGFQNFKSNTFMFSLLLFSPKDFAS